MAFARRRSLGRRPRSVRAKTRWDWNLADSAAVANNAINLVTLVSRNDYANTSAATGLEPDGPTLVRVRGYISYVPTLAAVHSVYMAILAHDPSIGPVVGTQLDPTIGVDLNRREPLWWASVINAPSITQFPHVFAIDIRAKRRLKHNNVSLIVRSAGGAAGNTGTMTVTLRALLRGDLY